MEVAIVLNSPTLNRNIIENNIIVADGGIKHVGNKKIDIIIGDFDSSEKTTNNNKIELNPIKNETDGQECLDYAISKGYKSIAVYGIGGGRLDHQLCNLSLLVRGEKAGIKMVGYDDKVEIYYKEKGSHSFNLKIGTEISIIAFGGECVLNNAKGLKYPLNNLKINSTNLGRAISNVAIDTNISFDVVLGGVLVFINNT